MKRVGETAWLLELPGDEETANALSRRAASRIREAAPAGLVDVVPAARTVLVTGTLDLDPASLAGFESATPESDPAPGRVPRTHRVAVRFDGDDLPEILRATDLDAESFEALFTSLTFTVGFLGFSPGFGYLYGLPKRLHLPRRASPRPRVAAGSVAIAGPYAAIYPDETAGGWNLVGRTDLRLFEPRADPPALLSPGDLVLFERA